jgi:hypothetical protein
MSGGGVSLEACDTGSPTRGCQKNRKRRFELSANGDFLSEREMDTLGVRRQEGRFSKGDHSMLMLFRVSSTARVKRERRDYPRTSPSQATNCARCEA